MGLKLLQEDVLALVSGSKDSSAEISDDDNAVSCHVSSISELKGKTMGVIDLSHQLLDNAEKAVSILSDLLNYDRIEKGDLPLELTIVAIWKLIETASVEFTLPFQAKGVNFVLDFSPLLLDPAVDNGCQLNGNSIPAQQLPRQVQEQRVVGDAIRLTQVIRNIVSNALKFTPEGGMFISTTEDNQVLSCNTHRLPVSSSPPHQAVYPSRFLG